MIDTDLLVCWLAWHFFLDASSGVSHTYLHTQTHTYTHASTHARTHCTYCQVWRTVLLSWNIWRREMCGVCCWRKSEQQSACCMQCTTYHGVEFAGDGPSCAHGVGVADGGALLHADHRHGHAELVGTHLGSLKAKRWRLSASDVTTMTSSWNAVHDVNLAKLFAKTREEFDDRSKISWGVGKAWNRSACFVMKGKHCCR